MKAKPCDCDHCRHRTDDTVCDCGHDLAEHREPFHICTSCLWCDAFRTRSPSRKPPPVVPVVRFDGGKPPHQVHFPTRPGWRWGWCDCPIGETHNENARP